MTLCFFKSPRKHKKEAQKVQDMTTSCRLILKELMKYYAGNNNNNNDKRIMRLIIKKK